MEDLNKKLERLLEADEWTEEEKQWLLNYLEVTETPELKQIMMRKFQEQLLKTQDSGSVFSNELLQNIHEKLKLEDRKTPVIRIWARRIAAACIAGMLVTGTYLWFDRKDNQRVVVDNGGQQKGSLQNDVSPGANKAMLTLADGSTISLDDAGNGALIQQGNTKLLKFDGKLTYKPQENRSQNILFNTITTPRGGQYQIALPDGTQVWLNAASSIRFPTVFSGAERKVELTGEAYFEVAKNANMPFRVTVRDAEVMVLGTHFNIMAYDEEEVLKTTLLEGSVQFSSSGKNAVLKPGQQSQLKPDGNFGVTGNVNLDEVIAWKNGMFNFAGADIRTVMRQLSRWYDVEIIYEEKLLAELFHADIPRNTNLSETLKALELTGKVHFRIEDKKIFVMP